MIRPIKLSPHQHRVLAAFEKKEDKDIYILQLYEKVYGERPLTVRHAQQKLAPIFRAMNEKWKMMNLPKSIVPGDLKQTYRIHTDRG